MLKKNMKNIFKKVLRGAKKMNEDNLPAETYVNEENPFEEELNLEAFDFTRPKKGVKRPMSIPTNKISYDDEEDIDSEEQESSSSRSIMDESDDQPDLGDYFAAWNISRRDQIHLCRAYASYLAVQDKSINKRDKSK